MGGSQPTQTSTQNVDNTTTNTLPDWYEDISRELAPQIPGMIGREMDPTMRQAIDNAGWYNQQAQGALTGANAGFNSAANYQNNDDWYSYARTGLDQVVRSIGSGGFGDPSYGGGGSTDSGARINRDDIRDITARSYLDYDVDEYMNPYTDSVVNDSLSDLERVTQQQQLQANQAAQAAGAFGGSRHGIANAMVASEGQRNAGQLSNQLRSQAYDAAMGLIGNEISNDLGAQGANQGADLSIAQANAQLADSAASRNSAAAGAGMAARQNMLSLLVNGGLNYANSGIGNDLAAAGLRLQGAQGLQNFGLGGLEAGYNAGQYADNRELNRLQGGVGALAGLPTSSTSRQVGTVAGTQTGTPGRNRFAGAAGGAASGAQIGSMFGPGYGTAIGAVAGGLLGAFA